MKKSDKKKQPKGSIKTKSKELSEKELDKISGGPIYMKYGSQ
jgi:bacteriocin-like protein